MAGHVSATTTSLYHEIHLISINLVPALSDQILYELFMSTEKAFLLCDASHSL